MLSSSFVSHNEPCDDDCDYHCKSKDDYKYKNFHLYKNWKVAVGRKKYATSSSTDPHFHGVSLCHLQYWVFFLHFTHFRNHFCVLKRFVFRLKWRSNFVWCKFHYYGEDNIHCNISRYLAWEAGIIRIISVVGALSIRNPLQKVRYFALRQTSPWDKGQRKQNYG
jgi:hypothetical protein